MVLKEIFGDGARIKLLEELIDNWGEWLTVEELSRMANVSSKSVYSHMEDLKNTGIVVEKNIGSKKFKLSEEDSRAVALALIQSDEFLRQLNEREVSLEAQTDVATSFEVSCSSVKNSDKKLFSLFNCDKISDLKFTPSIGGK